MENAFLQAGLGVSLGKGTGQPGTTPAKRRVQRTVFNLVSSVPWPCCISQRFAGSAET